MDDDGWATKQQGSQPSPKAFGVVTTFSSTRKVFSFATLCLFLTVLDSHTTHKLPLTIAGP